MTNGLCPACGRDLTRAPGNPDCPTCAAIAWRQPSGEVADPRRALVVEVMGSPLHDCQATGILWRAAWPDGWLPYHPDDRECGAQLLACHLPAGHEGIVHYDSVDRVRWRLA